ncbi:MAG: hypothetical protein V7752_05205 [Halopseudomonas sp.]
MSDNDQKPSAQIIYAQAMRKMPAYTLVSGIINLLLKPSSLLQRLPRKETFNTACLVSKTR